MIDDRPAWATELFERIDRMEEDLGGTLDRGFREIQDQVGQIGQTLGVRSGQMDRLLDLTHQNHLFLAEIRDTLRLGFNGRGGPTAN